MHTIKINTSQNIEIDYQVAGLGERILARLIDLSIFLVAGIALITLNYIIKDRQELYGLSVFFYVWLFLYAMYNLCEAFFNGQTVGKKMMKIRVISLDGSSPAFSQHVLRWLFRIVDFTLTLQTAGLVCIVLTENKQRIGDLVAGTTLIRTHPAVNLSHLLFLSDGEVYEPIFREAAQLTGKDVALIHEVIRNHKKNRNFGLLHTMATRIKDHLSITSPDGMDDFSFLTTIIRDYNFLAASASIV